jgi:inhibitor of cysteine peptidase
MLAALDFRQELSMLVPRLTVALSLALLTACAQTPSSVSLEQKQQNKCPLSLQVGQQFILRLPSNPTTGFRWLLRDAAPEVLQSLGPEVYSNPEDAGLVGSAGVSTWRFQVFKAGEGQLALTYERPWEAGVEPAQRFDCTIKAQ